jgi:signal transduction histidine kinase
VILADNAITEGGISDLDMEILQLFANESANAIENSRLYHELERRLVELRKVYQQHKQDQETLLRMERLSVMGETSAIVAHELRNPLVAIGGFARTLLRSLSPDDPNHQYATIITEEVSRLERIIHDLLDFVRPQKVRRKMVAANELVAETVRRYEGKMAENNIELVLDLQSPGVKVNVNPGEIQQVIQNLIVNAIQVLGEGGGIQVRTRRLAGGLQVEVLDDGPGFAEDMADQIFSPFFTTKPSGSGLGLTICSQIIKAHGGVLSARPRASGGAIFSFILPLPKPQNDSG